MLPLSEKHKNLNLNLRAGNFNLRRERRQKSNKKIGNKKQRQPEIDLTHICLRFFFSFVSTLKFFLRHSNATHVTCCGHTTRFNTHNHDDDGVRVTKSVYKIPHKLFHFHDSHGFLVSSLRRILNEAMKKSNKFYEFSISLATHDCITRHENLLRTPQCRFVCFLC